MSATPIEAIRGNVIRPGDADYDRARSVWNGMIDRSPEVIIQCLDVADVVNAVGFAREAGLGIAVRGGGHNAAGLAVADGALVVDLSRMRTVDVDPVARTARADGGTIWVTSTAQLRPTAWQRRAALSPPPASPVLR